MKLLPLSGPQSARLALQREVHLLARVSAACRHTVRLLGVTVKEGRLALVMPRYAASLRQHLDGQEGARQGLQAAAADSRVHMHDMAASPGQQAVLHTASSTLMH